MLKIWTGNEMDFIVKDNEIKRFSVSVIELNWVDNLTEALFVLLHHYVYEYLIVHHAELIDEKGGLVTIVRNGKFLVSLKRKRKKRK